MNKIAPGEVSQKTPVLLPAVLRNGIRRILDGPLVCSPTKAILLKCDVSAVGEHEKTAQRSMTFGLYLLTGAGNRTRTDDPRFTRAVLYQLSYAGTQVIRLPNLARGFKTKFLI